MSYISKPFFYLTITPGADILYPLKTRAAGG
jgi:hypothetical protein